MSEHMETVWHGALWRTLAPVVAEAPRPRTTLQQQVYEAVGADWQTTTQIAACLPYRSALVSMALMRLWRLGRIERERDVVTRPGRPAYRYRRVAA